MDQEDKGFLDKLLTLFKKGEEPGDIEDILKDIRHLVDAGKKQGLFSEEERKMIERILRLKNTTALDIMIPRTDMLCLPINTPLDALVRIIIEEGHTRIPVYEGDFDHIVGIVHAKDILKFWKKTGEETGMKDILRPAYFIPETRRVEELLKEFKAKKSHMAIVIDEYGTTAGLLTIEDILEEIVGEIQDEYDISEKIFEEVDKNTISVDAKIDIEKIEQRFDVEIPEGKYQSVGGFIINLVGRVPAAGEEISFGPLRMEIESANERKIDKVKITRTLLSEQEKMADSP
ncbi:MAG: hemolysin family protein [Thermodesulfobacteriota bacterium]|nr:hemolysin family protein [Thermodesulfobacteriota bacterium]